MDIGIDLGTTFSVIAVSGQVELVPEYPAGIYLEECDVTIIPTPYGEQTFPSVVWEDPDSPGEYVFGSDALQKADEGSAPVMFSKRKIGTREVIPLNDRVIVAKDVACEFLRYLRGCAEKALGQSVRRAVITHPAYFDRGAVEETREAAMEAGLDVSLPEQMLMEPVAAALAYTRTDNRDPLRILTYDLGGGTFDVTCLERSSGVIDMKSFDGNHLLGGYNFDRELVHWVRQRLAAQGRKIVIDEDDPEDRGRLARLLRIAERVKIALAEARTDTTPVEFRGRYVLVDVEGRPVQINERITRQEFVELIRPHLDDTIECCKRALTKAGLEASELDEALLVGGSTYGPWIADAIETGLDGVRAKLFSPDLCVGAGAAIHARMVLPSQSVTDDYTLTLDVPESSPIDLINVGGRITGPDDAVVMDQVMVMLRHPDGSLTDPLPLNEDGSFLFEDVELFDGEPSKLTLTFTSDTGARVMERAFQVTYAPEAVDISGVTTVLPKPLYVETVDGLVALAEEGATLPSRCERTFQRENDNPNISLKLYQDRDPIGEIRIEDIPPEGGKGAFVDLTVEVTEKNQIRGTARIRTRLNQIVAQTNVRVRFEVPDVPESDALSNEFEELRVAWLGFVLSGEERAAEIEGEVASLMRRIEHLFEQQPLERQEIYAVQRQLHHLLNPPEDDMKPTLREFSETVSRVKDSIEEMSRTAREAVDESGGGSENGTAQGATKGAERSIRQAQQYRELIAKLEQEGTAAHDRKDRKSLAHIYDAVTDIEAKVRKRQEQVDIPTVIAKMLASFEVMRLSSQLDEQEDQVTRAGHQADWEEEITRLRAAIDNGLGQLEAIEDDLPSDQGRARIRLVFARFVQPVRDSIGRVGTGDIRAVRHK